CSKESRAINKKTSTSSYPQTGKNTVLNKIPLFNKTGFVGGIQTATLAAYPGITFLGDATRTYNCHNFAWYMSGGGTTSVWMNQYNTGKLLGFLDKEHASVWHLSTKKPRLPITIGDAWALAPTS
ncbi:hypothetical protein, partial [Negadavirga shengliensis]